MRVAIRFPAAIAVNPMPVMIAAFVVFWSSAFAVAKVALEDCPPLLLLMARFLLAGAIILGAVAVMRTPWRLSRRDLAALALLGVANNALYLGLNYVGMRSISAGLSALIVSANPVLTAVLAAAVLGEPVTWRKAAEPGLGLACRQFIVLNR